MRGALGKLAGVKDIDIAAGTRDFSVSYDAAQVDVPKMLAALAAAGESAKVKP